MFDGLRRRSVLAVAAGVTSLSGCAGESPEDATENGETATATATPETTATDRGPTVDIEGTVAASSIRAGERVVADVTVTNEGDEGEVTLTLRLGDDAVGQQTVTLGTGESTTVEFETSPVDRYGTIELTVNGVSIGTVEVTHPPEIHVDPDGNDDDAGTATAPVATIQAGVERAQPGETVRVHTGEYRGPVLTRRSGEPDAPITITGPADAVLKPNPEDWRGMFEVHHSHVHLEGLTIDGLLDPDAPETASSYVDKALITVSPPSRSDPSPVSDEYLTDIVVTPDRLGNTQRNMVIVWRTEGVEIGEFEVIGPAGAGWVFNDKEEHIGEIVYLGQAPANVIQDFDWYPWGRYDETNDVHVHHIDNAAGHPHSELADAKLGTHDVTVEYCTDAGGSQNNETYTVSTVALRGHDATVRWNRLADGAGHGIEIRDRRGYNGPRIEAEPRHAVERAGTGNDIYGNQITGFDGEAVTITEWVDGEPFEQGYICGNEIKGETDFAPESDCGDAVPGGDGLGHLGGDSPWET
jgi:hypothetical protein